MKHLLPVLFLFLYFGASAKTIYIGAKRAIKNPQAGINAAVDGDTVLVDPGHYREKNLTIRKRIVFRGVGYPILDGENKYEILSVYASGVTVDGFRIIHSGVSSLDDLSGIKVYN